MFHGYDGAPNFTMPSIRYETFNQQRANLLKKQREELELLEAAETPYNVFITLLERAGLKNDVTVSAYNNSFTAALTLLPHDKLKSFVDLAQFIGIGFVDAGMIHEDYYEDGQYFCGSYYARKLLNNEAAEVEGRYFTFSWTIKTPDGQNVAAKFALQIVVPVQGTIELKVQAKPRKVTYEVQDEKVSFRGAQGRFGSTAFAKRAGDPKEELGTITQDID